MYCLMLGIGASTQYIFSYRVFKRAAYNEFDSILQFSRINLQVSLFSCKQIPIRYVGSASTYVPTIMILHFFT